MTQSFDDYEKSLDGYVPCYREAYEDGYQSRQYEINELRKRIDRALEIIYTEKGKSESGAYCSVDADLILGIGYDLHLVLTGGSNEQ